MKNILCYVHLLLLEYKWPLLIIIMMFFQNMENYEILKQKYAYTNKLFHEIDTKIGNGAEIIKERELRDQSLELLKKMQSIIKQNGLLE